MGNTHFSAPPPAIVNFAAELSQEGDQNGSYPDRKWKFVETTAIIFATTAMI